MIDFLWKLQFSGLNILKKKLFWKENERNWFGIYILFQHSILKPALLPTTTELRKPQILRWIIHRPDELQDFLSADTIKDFNHLEEEKFCRNVFNESMDSYRLALDHIEIRPDR